MMAFYQYSPTTMPALFREESAVPPGILFPPLLLNECWLHHIQLTFSGNSSTNENWKYSISMYVYLTKNVSYCNAFKENQ